MNTTIKKPGRYEIHEDYHIAAKVFSSQKELDLNEATKWFSNKLSSTYPLLNNNTLQDLVLGFRETFANALFHGNLKISGNVGDALNNKAVSGTHQSIIVTLKTFSDRFEVSIQDEGGGFSLSTSQDPLDNHGRGFTMISKFYYGQPVEVEFIRDSSREHIWPNSRHKSHSS